MNSTARYVLIKCPRCKGWGAWVSFQVTRYFAKCQDAGCGHQWITQAYARMANVDWNSTPGQKKTRTADTWTA